jgi:hypothetical protein
MISARRNVVGGIVSERRISGFGATIPVGVCAPALSQQQRALFARLASAVLPTVEHRTHGRRRKTLCPLLVSNSS